MAGGWGVGYAGVVFHRDACLWLSTLIGLVILASSAFATPAAAADQQAAAPPPPVGDRHAVWLIEVHANDTFHIEYLPRTDGELGFVRRPAVHGPLLPGGVAGGDGTLWLIYDDLAIQSVQPQTNPLDGSMRLPLLGAAPLPAGVKVLGLAADASGLWALVAIDDDEQAQQRIAAIPPLDHDPEPEPEQAPDADAETDDRAGDSPDPTDTPEAPDTDPDAAHGDEDAPPAAADDRADQSDPPRHALLRLSMGERRWQRVAPPPQWPQDEDAAHWLVLLDPARPGRLALVSLSAPQPQPQPEGDEEAEADGEEDTRKAALRVHHLRGVERARPRWQPPEVYALEPGEGSAGAAGQPVAAAIAGQAVFGRGTVREGRLVLELTALRPDGPVDEQGRVQPLPVSTAQMPVDVEEGEGVWSLIGMGDTAALVHVGPGPGREVTWMRLFLSGRTTEPQPVDRTQRPGPATSPRVMVFSVAFTLAVLLLVLHLRRETGQRLSLSESMAVVDLPPRLLAGVVDLGVLVLLAWLVTPHDLGAIVRSHPALATSFPAMIPFATIIGVYVLYSIFSEWVGHGTMGKRLMRLRVVDLRGRRPGPWPIIVRNLVKIVELVTIVLLVVAVFTTYRQRLGDLLAATVVVIPLEGDDSGEKRRKDAEQRRDESDKDKESQEDQSLRDAESDRSDDDRPNS